MQIIRTPQKNFIANNGYVEHSKAMMSYLLASAVIRIDYEKDILVSFWILPPPQERHLVFMCKPYWSEVGPYISRPLLSVRAMGHKIVSRISNGRITLN